MKLYYAPAPARSGEDFRAINPKGYVPALRLDDGTLLTEGPAIVSTSSTKSRRAGSLPSATAWPNGSRS